MQVDIEQLKRRSEGTVWKLDGVKAWLADTKADARCLCILAGAGG